MAQTFVRPILPKVMPKDSRTVRNEIRRVVKRVSDMAAEELRFLVETWEHQPQPVVRVSEAGDRIVGSAYTEDTAMFMLDGGTSIRWALMSQDFKAKTSHKSLRSGPGRGRAVLRGKSAMQKAGREAQPGIEKREFSVALAEKYGPLFENMINSVIEDSVVKGQAVKV